MNMEEFYRAEQIAEEHNLNTIIMALFMICDTLETGDKLKEMFPDEWLFVMKGYTKVRLPK